MGFPVSSETGVFLIDCSRWYLARIVEEFNARGEFPTAAEVDKKAHELDASGEINFYLGFDENVALVLKRHAARGFYGVIRLPDLNEGFKALPNAIQTIRELERDPRYLFEFMCIIQ